MANAPRYSRLHHGKGFRYLDSQGDLVRDSELLTWFKSIGIPPAWRNVEIVKSERAKIIATGFDAAGRKQYIYNPTFRAAREKAKFDRLLNFAEALPRMRRVTGKHLRRRKLDREKVLACMVRLIDQAYFRVGSERYAAENKTYGLATLRSRHLNIVGDRLVFEYVGKSHKINHREVRDPLLAKIVAEIDDLPGYEIFKYINDKGEIVDVKSEDLNAYIKDIMGHDFSAKDFRTWAGTLIAAVALAELHPESSSPPLKKNVVEAVKHVAERLGNTPSIAKASYIDPRIINHYLNGTTINSFREEIDEIMEREIEDLNNEEIAVLKMLRKRLVKKA